MIGGRIAWFIMSKFFSLINNDAYYGESCNVYNSKQASSSRKELFQLFFYMDRTCN